MKGLVGMQFDDDTMRLIAISKEFLCIYFSHTPQEADRLVERFVARPFFTEDEIHHESGYRVAAAIHYVLHLAGDRNRLGDWLISEGHASEPDGATRYFWTRYLKGPGF